MLKEKLYTKYMFSIAEIEAIKGFFAIEESDIENLFDSMDDNKRRGIIFYIALSAMKGKNA